MTAAVDTTLASLALTGYLARKCRCGVLVEPRFAEQIELSTGRVPTVVWDCPGCGEKRAVRYVEPTP